MRQLKAYWRIMQTSAREDGTNIKRLATSVLQQVCRMLLIIAIYHVAYSVSAHHALSYQNTLWTTGLCFAFFINLGIRNVYKPVEFDIKTGAVETGLIRPLDWRLVKFCELIGKSGVEFLVQLIVLPTVLLLVVGPPSVAHLTPVVGLTFILFFILAVTTAGALFMTIGLSAFWLNDAQSVYRIIDKMALIFCGTFVPLALLPSFMQTAIFFLPFNIYAAPTRLFDPTLPNVLVPTLISGIVWTIAMLIICQFVWQRANKKMEVNGG